MVIPPNYTENIPEMIEPNWKSDDKFVYSVLSDVANSSLKDIFPHYKDITQCKLNKEDLLDLDYCGDDIDVNKLVDDFRGPAIYIGIWLSLAIIFTIVGVIWCICNKCCCCCKGKKGDDLDYLVNTESDEDLRQIGVYQGDRKHNLKLVWRITLAVLMTCWVIGFSFSVFMSFASNEGFRTSVFELYDDLDLSLDDAEMYIDITNRQVNATFVTSFGNLSEKILEEFPPEVPTGNLHINSQALSSRILLHSNVLITQLGHSMELKGLSDLLRELQVTLNHYVNPFLSRMEQVGRNPESDVKEALRKTKEELDRNAKDITDAINEIQISKFREELEKAEDEYLDVVGSAIYGSFMGFNLILLLILIGIVIGSVVVWIAKGPAKNIGFIFYRFSIVMMFVLGWIIACVMVTQFAISGFLIHDVCEELRDLENNSTDDQIQMIASGQGFLIPLNKSSFAEMNEDYSVPSYSYVINHCKHNSSAYAALNLELVYNASSIKDISDNFNFTSSKVKIDDLFFTKNLYALRSSLYHELKKLESFKTVVADISKSETLNGTEGLYSEIHSELVSLLQELETLRSPDIERNFPANTVDNIIFLVDDYEEFVYEQVTARIGKCHPIYYATNQVLDTVCNKLLIPVASYWWSLQLLLVMMVALISTALISERVFK